MLTEILSPVLHWLLQTSIHASLIIISILLARRLFKNRLTPGWSYILWLILLCRLLIPQPLSIELPEFLHSVHPLQLSQHYTLISPAPNSTVLSADEQALTVQDALTPALDTKQFDIETTLLFIWLSGLILVAVFYFNKLNNTRKHIRHCPAIQQRQILNSLNELKTNLGIARKIDIRLSKNIAGPASFGLIRPVVLLPVNALALDPRQLALVLEHELLHHKRLDIAVDAVMRLIKAVHWFNPLLWYAHRLMREDCELSCDYRVTRAKDETQKRLYAGLLINYATRQSIARQSYSMTLMSENFSGLASRIQKIIEQPVASVCTSLQTMAISITVAALGLTTPSTSLAIETHLFDYSTGQGVSEFSSNRLSQMNRLKSQEKKRISGQLTQPRKSGKHPAIVLVHGCEGFDTRHENWVTALHDMGYVTFRIQRHGVTTPYCENPIAQINTFTAAQVMDAYAALDYLALQPFVDASNINIMSWESWGAIGAAATFGIGQVYKNQFNSAIAMYPDCTATYNGEFNSPLLIMVGDSDLWAQANDCLSIETIANKSQNSQVKVKVYEDTFHGFDHSALSQATFLPYAKNLGHLSATGATAKYNRAAHFDARRQISAFLSENFDVNQD